MLSCVKLKKKIFGSYIFHNSKESIKATPQARNIDFLLKI